MSNLRFVSPGLLFILVPIWKILLFLVSAQPVPANDSFFYDGSVVNFLLHGRYINPSLALALPISGTEVFSAYPPLYQVVLLAWMSLFGTSALAAMALHLALFAIYVAVLWAILRQLKTPAWCMYVAGLFLFVITFHDRPDSLAHVLGISALYAWLRSKPQRGDLPSTPASGPWEWLMAGLVILTFCTSLQLGAIYGLMIWAAVIAAKFSGQDRLPVLPLLATVLVPVALAALVRFQFPHLWAGFLEHARQTPSLVGWHRPQLGDMLKVARTVSGGIAGACLLAWVWLRFPKSESSELLPRVVAFSCSVAILAVLAGCLLILTPNLVTFAAYPQPILVAASLALTARHVPEQSWLRKLQWGFVGLALIGAIRAFGMSTWGLACARDFGYSATVQRVRQEAATTPAGQTAVFSAAYLYEAARYDQIRWIHSDWLAKAQRDEPEPERALLELRPAKLVLTQFDYYRRYERLLTTLQARNPALAFRIVNCGQIPSPDSFPSFQRVLQHISWAPVIVTFSWK
jgi:hypothetical protein